MIKVLAERPPELHVICAICGGRIGIPDVMCTKIEEPLTENLFGYQDYVACVNCMINHRLSFTGLMTGGAGMNDGPAMDRVIFSPEEVDVEFAGSIRDALDEVCLMIHIDWKRADYCVLSESEWDRMVNSFKPYERQLPVSITHIYEPSTYVFSGYSNLYHVPPKVKRVTSGTYVTQYGSLNIKKGDSESYIMATSSGRMRTCSDYTYNLFRKAFRWTDF